MTQRLLRILFCIQNFAGGGAEGVTLELARHLDRERFAPTVFAHERLPWFAPPDSMPALSIVVKNDGVYRRDQLPGLFARTLTLAREHDVIVGANEGRPTFLGLAAAKVLRKPFVMWTHYNMREFVRNGSWRQRLMLRIGAAADALVSCGSDALESAIAVTGVSPSRAFAIPNGIPVQAIQRLAQEPVAASDERYFETPTILSVGRLTEQKDPASLIAAHALLRDQGGNQSLLLIGAGHLEAALRAQAQRLGVAGSVHFLGYRSNPFAYMRRCTVMGHAARYEGFGLVLAEALACGACVVATDCPSGPREILDGGRFGLLVPVSDPQALAEGLGRVLRDEPTRTKFKATAVSGAERFDVSRMAGQWGQLFERLDRRRPGA
jgi:glycosyltransferase involved in cell wall biosynthesis